MNSSYTQVADVIRISNGYLVTPWVGTDLGGIYAPTPEAAAAIIARLATLDPPNEENRMSQLREILEEEGA